jgi:hypothetical protein
MKHAAEWLCRRWTLIFATACLVTLTGCLAVIPAIQVAGMASGGFAAFKFGQGQMKSAVEVKFDTPEIDDKAALAGITNIAVWPAAKGQTVAGGQQPSFSPAALAEQLSGTGKFAVVTPLVVAQALESNSLSQFAQDMTESEELQAFKLVCEKTGADAVLCSTPADMKANAKFFTVSRATTTYGTVIQIYSARTGGIVWRDAAAVAVKQGSTAPDHAEMEKSFVAELAKRILQATAKESAQETR